MNSAEQPREVEQKRRALIRAYHRLNEDPDFRLVWAHMMESLCGGDMVVTVHASLGDKLFDTRSTDVPATFRKLGRKDWDDFFKAMIRDFQPLDDEEKDQAKPTVKGI